MDSPLDYLCPPPPAPGRRELKRYDRCIEAARTARDYQLSVPGGMRIIEKNVAELAGLYKHNKLDAIKLWGGAVSEGQFSWIFEETVSWNYKGGNIPQSLGITRSQGEKLGNANFAITTYNLAMDLLTDAGLPDEVADPIATWFTKLTGGGNQMLKDIPKAIRAWELPKKAYTWYGEEEKDATWIDKNIDFARFQRLSRAAAGSGVVLDPTQFGFGDQHNESSPFKLLDENQDLSQIARELQLKVDAAIELAKRNREARERELKREQERKRAIEEEDTRAQKPIPLVLP